MLRKFMVFSIIATTLIGCTPIVNKPTVTQPPINTAIIPPSTTPTKIVLTSTATLAPYSDSVIENCLDVLPSMPAGFNSIGIVPLEDFQTRSTAFLNLATGDTNQIPTIEKWIASYAISPDRKTLAYKTYDKSGISLMLTNALNSHKKIIFSRQADYALYYWLNNEELLLGKNNQWIIFNPYTKQETDYSIDDFLNFDTDNIRNDWVLFDPSVSRAIYKNGDILLLDMDTKQIIAEIRDEYDRTPIAAWTLDGNEVAVIGATQLGQYLGQSGDDIFGISRDGQVTQLTHLTENYGIGFTIHSLSWSPDSRYIAFWMWHSEIPNWRLALLDMTTRKITDYCIETDPYASSGQVLREVSAPIWSPDGKQIIVEHRNNDSASVILLDVGQNIAFQIAQDKVPMGWMLTP